MKLGPRLETFRDRARTWAGTAPVPARFAGAVGAPLAVFGLVVLGIGIDSPGRFMLFAAIVAVGLGMLSRLGLIGAVRDLSRTSRVVASVAALTAVFSFPLTQLRDPFWIQVAANGAIFAALALGLNIVVGRTGLLDLGYAAFYGIGAYAAAMLAECTRCPVHARVPWFVSLLISGVVGALFGVLLGFPVLRLRGDYLAIVTLGFGEIVRTALNNLDRVPFTGNPGVNLTNGPNGLFGVGHPVVGPFDFSKSVRIFGIDVPNVINYYYVSVILMVIIVVVVRRIDSSRVGRAWTAIREDELAARAMGINTTVAKLLAFASGAFFGGIAGNLFVHLQTGTAPEDFSFTISVTVLAMVVLGGMGNTAGVVLGSVLLTAIPDKLRFVHDKRFLIFGAVLILMMRFRPEGLIPEERRKRELAEMPPEAEAVAGSSS